MKGSVYIKKQPDNPATLCQLFTYILDSTKKKKKWILSEKRKKKKTSCHWKNQTKIKEK